MFSIDLNLEFLIRVVLAGICGIIIGYERRTRGKGAGVRTHMIVALASSLMMIISKYGFSDMGTSDGSRVAAQIVSGVGFLGAGMIYIHRNSVSGLTTAAGIWATAGIGMAIGAGMYFIGIASAIVILLSQIFLHKDLKLMQTAAEYEFEIIVSDSEEGKNCIKEIFTRYDFHTEKIKTSKENGMMTVKATVATTSSFEIKNIIDETSDIVKSISIS